MAKQPEQRQDKERDAQQPDRAQAGDKPDRLLRETGLGQGGAARGKPQTQPQE
jgi:hypothetical protein